MTDQPKLIEIDVCSGPTLSRAERLALASRPQTQLRPDTKPATPQPPVAEAAE